MVNKLQVFSPSFIVDAQFRIYNRTRMPFQDFNSTNKQQRPSAPLWHIVWNFLCYIELLNNFCLYRNFVSHTWQVTLQVIHQIPMPITWKLFDHGSRKRWKKWWPYFGWLADYGNHSGCALTSLVYTEGT